MALQLTPNTESIKIKGTDIELTSIYARASFVAQPDGTTISVSFKTYLDADKFTQGEEIATNLVHTSFDFAILESEEQSLQVALDYSIVRFNELGYNAVIV